MKIRALLPIPAFLVFLLLPTLLVIPQNALGAPDRVQEPSMGNQPLPGVGPAFSAYMVPFDFKQPGQFTVQIPWRLGPEATSCPLQVHAFMGYTWMLQEQIDLQVLGIDVEVNGEVLSFDAGPYTFSLNGDEQVIRKAGSKQPWWYRLYELPIRLFPPDQRSRVRVKIHRRGKSRRRFVPVPGVFGQSPDMRIDWKDSPYEGEEAGWFLFEIYRSSKALPSLTGFRSGDLHVHTEYTHHSFEYGGPIETYAAAAKAIGLDYATFTDHGHSFDSRENLEKFNQGATYPPFGPRQATELDAKWNEFVSRTRAISELPGRPFLGIVGTEVDVRAPSNDGHDYFCHALVYGHGKPIPAEGPNGIDVKIGPVKVRNGEKGRSGQADVFGADTLSLEGLLTDVVAGRFGDVYGPDSLVTYLSHPINKHDKFKENRVHIGHWWRWGFDDDPDELPRFYAEEAGRLRVSGFQVFNGNSIPYAEEIDPSIPYWDRILCDGLRMRPVRRNAIGGGSDTHGDLTSSSVRNSEPGLDYWRLSRKPDGDGFGTVRTLAACPDGLTAAGVLSALKHGQTVVTNGPAMLIGVDRNGDGKLIPGQDAIPSTRPGDEVRVDLGSPLKVNVVWNSTQEFGPVQEVRIVMGRPTGPEVVWRYRPAGQEGLEGAATVEIDAADLPEWVYLRGECVTREGQDVVKGERLIRRVERRAYTNPVWFQRGEGPGSW